MSDEQINTKASRTVMIMAITATFASLGFGYDTGVIMVLFRLCQHLNSLI